MIELPFVYIHGHNLIKLRGLKQLWLENDPVMLGSSEWLSAKKRVDLRQSCGSLVKSKRI